MKKALSYLILLVGTVFCLLSCEADGGGSSYLDGYYVLQSEEIHLKMNQTQNQKDYIQYAISIDIPSKTYTMEIDGYEPFTATLPEKEWTSFMRETVQSGLGAPVGVEFHKDGSALVDEPEKWYEEVEYWDFWFDQEDLDNFRAPIKYSVSNDVVTFTFLHVTLPFFKIISNSGNTLKVELTKQALKESSDILSENLGDGFKVIVESTTAVYKK